MKSIGKNSYNKHEDNEELSKINEKLNFMENEIHSINNNVKKIAENVNQSYLDSIESNLKNEFIRSINGYMLEKTDEVLDQRMVKDCDMKKQCKTVFKKYLNKHTQNLSPDNLTDEKIRCSKEELEDLRKVSINDKCDVCFDEVSGIFDHQIELINSLRIYENHNKENKKEISSLDEIAIVNNILDPISNKQRLQILKFIALEPKTFTTISNFTGLRGGSLLFHLKKLQNANLIFQKEDHGEYILTTKGFDIINILLNL
ncbi:winged helix-turn-helix domain-containing protein [Methanobrevibacter filiformis]|uniref:HTH arsR-type domain-containing protein n=1 Tax=Methanobrevibacter filiformis TaxID=55758 RepID=A0A166CWS2_9EURY|nr:winged helix-turn-helix domain-containing protein [Methanobrevibacter filiformis]KZX17317.1 hypothetical protein MBFIL_02300 [Methanobrevibacter filiformis]